jgi:hypothetical protein
VHEVLECSDWSSLIFFNHTCIKYSFLIISISNVLDPSQHLFLVMNTLSYATLPGTCCEEPHVLQLLMYDAEYCSAWVAMVGKPMLYSSIFTYIVQSQDTHTKIISAYPSPMNFVFTSPMTQAFLIISIHTKA